ncbi:MAG TPA: right-handed parallel beta-helix repeat-containing protein, partial [Methanomassiliicoccales archaeon]|nr:right-handed parallel beta-helix repeat-containing protein [Methanomassiliicoccales archaeon]
MLALVFLSIGMSGSAEAAPASIYIASDDELDSFIATNGWPGDGSEGDPYQIYLLNIDATGNGYAIYLTNVHKHLIISDCTLENANHAGIGLNSVSNVTLAGNTIRNNADLAVEIYSSNNVTLDANDCWNNPLYGFSIRISSNIEVVANYVNNSDQGFTVEYVDNSSFSNNIFETMGYSGIYLYYSDNNTFSNNSVRDSWFGIYLQFSHGNSVDGTMCGYLDYDAIHLYESNHTKVTNSTLAGSNSYAGIYVGYSSYNLISNNKILDSTLFMTYYGVCLDVAD